MNHELFETGLEIRREVLGSDYVDAAFAQADDFTGAFQRFVTEYCWGASWGRGTLTRRDRSLLNLVMLGALNRAPEFRIHVRGAVRNGCTRAEIQEALLQMAVYAGVPAGAEAFRLAQAVFAEIDAEGADG